MVTVFFIHENYKIALRGTLAEVLENLRTWCPGGKLKELFPVIIQ